MRRQAIRWMAALPLAVGLFLAWPHAKAWADLPVGSSLEQKTEESKTKAGHLDDQIARRSTLKAVFVVLLIGMIFAIYFIRKDKTEDKDLKE